MATSTVTIDSELLSSVSISAADQARDLDHIKTPFLSNQAAVHGAGSPNRTTGARWIHAVATGSHSEPTRAQTGYEQLNLTFHASLKPLQYTPEEVIFPVGLSVVEEEFNSGANQTIALAGQRIGKVVNEAQRRFEKYMFQGPNLDTRLAAFSGFGHLNGVDEIDGILEENAPGAQTNTYAGFAKSSYLTVEGAQNSSADVGGSFNSGGLDALHKVIVRSAQRAAEGSDKIHVYASEDAQRQYALTLQGQERYTMTDKVDGVIRESRMAVGGHPLSIQSYMPNTGSVTATSEVSFIIIDHAALWFCWNDAGRKGYFSVSEWMEVGMGYNVRIAQVVVKGQTWVDSWGPHAVIVNGDTF